VTEATDLAGCAVGGCERHPAGVLCAKHRHEVEALLDGRLARAYVELHLAARERRRPAGDIVVSMSREKALPIGAEARAAQERALELVLQAEDALREAQGWIRRPPRGREGPTLQGSCRVLHAHLEEVLDLPGAGQWADRLVRLGRRSDYAAGREGPRVSRSDAPCPHCGAFALLRRDGTDDVSCGYCGEAVQVDAIDDWLAA
jgi:hypothetical protein